MRDGLNKNYLTSDALTLRADGRFNDIIASLLCEIVLAVVASIVELVLLTAPVPEETRIRYPWSERLECPFIVILG